jgi:hypothetical protein
LEDPDVKGRIILKNGSSRKSMKWRRFDYLGSGWGQVGASSEEFIY